MGQKNLPVASGRAHQRAFERLGWVERGHKRNSHIIMVRTGTRVTLAIPNHDEVKRALLAKLLRGAEISERDYLRAFRGK